jgi:hypothetical protein
MGDREVGVSGMASRVFGLCIGLDFLSREWGSGEIGGWGDRRKLEMILVFYLPIRFNWA